MRRVAAAVIFISVACLLPKGAKAQSLEVRGPSLELTGPSFELDLPPLLRVRVGPVPVVRLHGPRLRVGPPRRPRVAQMAPPPPPPPASAPPPPSVNVYVVTPDDGAPPPPPPPRRRRYRRRRHRVHHRRRHVPQRLGLTIGAHADSAFYEKGGMGGAGLNARWRFARHWALTFSLSGMGSCTRCSEESNDQRADVGWTLGVMYFFMPRHWLTPYVRAAFAANHSTLKVEGSQYKATQAGAEIGAGLEWRLTQWLALFADANVLALAGDNAKAEAGGEVGFDSIQPAKGIPPIQEEDVAGRFRLGLVVKF